MDREVCHQSPDGNAIRVDVMTQRGVGRSAETDLAENALAGEQLGGQADHKAEHGKAAIPGFSEGNETETGSGGVSHGCWKVAKLDSL